MSRPVDARPSRLAIGCRLTVVAGKDALVALPSEPLDVRRRERLAGAS